MEFGSEALERAAARTFLHRAFGLSIHSELKLPELAAATESGVDLDFRFQQVDLPPAAVENPVFFDLQPGRQLLHWRAVGSFLIRAAREIDIEPAAGVDPDILRLPLLGPVMALLLHQRGALVLHASAIEVGGRAAIFLGDKQAGKSTTAAALLSRGHRLLTDDVLSIDFSGAAPQVVQGYPSMKLDAELCSKFFAEEVMERSNVIPGTGKRRLQLSVATFADWAVDVGAIFVLSPGEEVRLSRLSTEEAFTSLLRFSYVARFGSGAMDADAAAGHLRRCGALVRASPIYRLEIPRDLGRLDHAMQLVEDKLSSSVSS